MASLHGSADKMKWDLSHPGYKLLKRTLQGEELLKRGRTPPHQGEQASRPDTCRRGHDIHPVRDGGGG